MKTFESGPYVSPEEGEKKFRAILEAIDSGDDQENTSVTPDSNPDTNSGAMTKSAKTKRTEKYISGSDAMSEWERRKEEEDERRGQFL